MRPLIVKLAPTHQGFKNDTTPDFCIASGILSANASVGAIFQLVGAIADNSLGSILVSGREILISAGLARKPARY